MLFCHITSRVKSDPYQNLLAEKGGDGFPYLAFMDAGGNVLARHDGPRTVEGFKETALAANDFLSLKAKAAKGDKQARYRLLVAQLELGQLTSAEARKKLDEMKYLTKEQRDVIIIGPLANLEVREIGSSTITSDKASREEAAKKFLEMKKAGRLPTGSRETQFFWITIMSYAETEKDAVLFEEGLNALKARFASNPRAQKFFEEKEALLQKLKEGSKQ
ncbi:MAG: hypothetical protein HYU64_03740 [Armatimonadetes bacterium]|nr:hypothetical protein [Armatimonadota bacterium]